MKSADQLMKKKGFLKTEMDKVMPKEQSDVMWRALMLRPGEKKQL